MEGNKHRGEGTPKGRMLGAKERKEDKRFDVVSWDFDFRQTGA